MPAVALPVTPVKGRKRNVRLDFWSILRSYEQGSRLTAEEMDEGTVLNVEVGAAATADSAGDQSDVSGSELQEFCEEQVSENEACRSERSESPVGRARPYLVSFLRGNGQSMSEEEVVQQDFRYLLSGEVDVLLKRMIDLYYLERSERGTDALCDGILEMYLLDRSHGDQETTASRRLELHLSRPFGGRVVAATRTEVTRERRRQTLSRT